MTLSRAMKSPVPRKDPCRPVGILGLWMYPVGKHPALGYLDLLLGAIRGAVAEAGLGLGHIEGLYVTPDDFGARETPMPAARLPELLGVPVRGLALVECGGTTGALALKTALQDLRLGHVDIAVVAASRAIPVFSPIGSSPPRAR